MPSFTPCCAHDHDCADEDCGAAYSLYKHIDMPRVRCLNEATEGSVRGVFRRWEDRLDFSGLPLASYLCEGVKATHTTSLNDIPLRDALGANWLWRGPSPARPRAIDSDDMLRSNEDDEELLIHVPFDGSVKLKAICLIGAPDGFSPGELRVFTNRDDLDFATAADLPPTQSWELTENLDGRIELPTQVTRFNGVHSLDLHIPRSLGAPETRVHFIGLKGDFTERRREAVIAVYEARAVPSDHQKVPGTDQLQGWNPTA